MTTPNGARRSWVYTSRLPDHGPTSDLDELGRVLDRLAALAAEEGVGQSIEFRPVDAEGNPDIDEAFVVDIDLPPGGWALMYDNSRTGSGGISVNGSGDDSEVELQWADEWSETEAQCFIDQNVARDAALTFFRTEQLPATVEWA